MRNIIIIIVITFISCNTNKSIVGGYLSSQNILPWGPDQIIYLQEDSTYCKIYSAINEGYFEGEWTINGDTLFLEDIYEVTKIKRELVDEEWMAKRTKYIRQGKVWCSIYSVDKPKKQRYILKKSNRITKEDLLKWTFQ